MGQGRPLGMMNSRVYSSGLPDLRSAVRLAGPARPLAGVQERELLVLRYEVTVLRHTLRPHQGKHSPHAH
jgi:hypothetical protein